MATMTRSSSPKKFLPVSSMNRGLSTKDVRNLVNSEAWTYYDTLILSAGIVPPNPVVMNFAAWTNPMTFFDQRTKGNAGLAVCNSGDKGKFENDFVCESISVDVMCDHSAPRGSDDATAVAFAECIINAGVLVLEFGTITKLMRPVIDCPSGGGIVGAFLHTAATPDDADQAIVNNGLQTAQARRRLPEPIFFEKGATFALSLYVDDKPTANATLARIQALTALATTSSARVRVKLEGRKGSPLLVGVPRK